MNAKKSTVILMTLIGLLAVTGIAYGHQEEHRDRTLSPYFFLKSDDPGVDQLPLKSTTVRADIAGVIANVLVTQVYKNEGTRPLEAVYIFPASTRAAVYGMKMTIGDRVITARINKREEARREYEQAKQQGKSASLLEQQRPNVFQMNVANILPSDIITVELRYTELLTPTDRVYEFVYPTVVGPRYSNQSIADSPPSERWVANPYLHQGEQPTYTFGAAVTIAAGLPIQHVTCPSHGVSIDYDGPSRVALELDPEEKNAGNRDFIVKYRLAGDTIESGLLLFEGEKENFFLLMVQPPKRVAHSQIPSREYIFIVDVSGSMHGFPLNTSKNLLKDLIGRLRPTDRFNLLLFAGRSFLMSEQSVPANPENIRHAIDVIEHQRGGGGTELLPALKRALSLPSTEGYARSIVIATDGYVTVETEAFELIRNKLGDANVFTFGIGSSVNRYIIEGMARAGMGEPFIVTGPDEAQKRAEQFRKLIQSPVLTGVGVNFGRFEVYDVEPPSIPDVMADRPVIVFGKWRGIPEGTIRIQGIAGDHPFREAIGVDSVIPAETNRALRYLWARHRIAHLSDYNKLKPNNDCVGEVTELGLRYNLLTAYTSFVAIDTRIRRKDGHVVTVKQPLPLPQGVSDLAVGNGSRVRKAASPAAPSAQWFGVKAGITKEVCGENESGKQEALDSAVSKPPDEPIRLELKKIKVSKGLSKKAVTRLIKRHINAFEACFNRAAKGNPHLKGTVVLYLHVTSTGEIDTIKVVKNNLNGEALVQCIAQKLMAVRVPSRKDSKGAMITVTLKVG
ncbi:MAG: AgmX/PglI C-terminal domain-containing protein [Deltaproteobacteria bacterium]|nr:MAG: AgmX/PglI C-terminal domain-containing protein [Deltaproteobacteria bacterium]